MLKRFTLAELRQLAVYMSEFQECALITPENARQKKCWLNTTNQMIIRKAPDNPGEYITRLRTIIRWFINHKINLRIGMKDSYVFFEKITNNFTRNISATVIHLEDRQRNFIDINKNDLILPYEITSTFRYDPNTMDRYYFYDDDHRTPVARQRRQIPPPVVPQQIPPPVVPQQIPPPVAQQQPPPPVVVSQSLLFDEDVVRTSKQHDIPDEEVTDETRTLECKICVTNKICVVLTRCGHTFCNSCTQRFENKCATCRAPFTNFSKVRMYI